MPNRCQSQWASLSWAKIPNANPCQTWYFQASVRAVFQRFCMVSTCFFTCDLLMPNEMVFFDVLSGDGGTFLTHLLYIKTVTDLHRTWLPRLISRWMMLFACKCPALLQRVLFFTWTCRVFKSCVDKNGGESMEISFITRVIHQELPHGSKCLPRSKSPGLFFYTSTQSVKEAGCSHLDHVSWTQIMSNH